MKFSMTGQEKDDLSIEVTAQTGLAVHMHHVKKSLCKSQASNLINHNYITSRFFIEMLQYDWL